MALWGTLRFHTSFRIVYSISVGVKKCYWNFNRIALKPVFLDPFLNSPLGCLYSIQKWQEPQVYIASERNIYQEERASLSISVTRSVQPPAAVMSVGC